MSYATRFPRVSDARHVLLGRLVDFAGLFPPARMSMEDAVATFRSARAGVHAWMLDRFLCPASRIGELASAVEGERWRVSVVVDRGDLTDLGPLEDSLAAAATDALEVDLVELRMGPGRDRIPERVAALRGTASDSGLPGPVRLFVEVRPDGTLETALDALAAAQLCAKIRCGGETTPSPQELARFVEGCARRELPWKATAGLHHPFRHHSVMTGEQQHGFLNLLAGAGLAAAGAPAGEALASEDPDDFELDAHGLRFRGRDVSDGARELLVAYGSCSFDEPVHDLQELGIL